MDSYLLLTLTITLMFAGSNCFSTSMSCSTVNGRTICEKQSGGGNTAGSFSGAFSGPGGGAYQDAAAMTGNTFTRNSQSSRTVLDGRNLRGFGFPGFYPNYNAGPRYGSGYFTGTGASDATSFRSDTGLTGLSTSGFRGTSNNNGIPVPAFGGFAVADSSGNNFYGGGNTYGGGYAHGQGGAYPGFPAFGRGDGFFVGGGPFPGFPAFGTGGGVFVGNPDAFQNVGKMFSSFGFGSGFPFNMFGRKR